MNRKIKYLFFLISFITINIVISIILVLGCVVLSEFVFVRIQLVLGAAEWSGALFRGRSIASILGLLGATMLSIIIYRRLYRYMEERWYIHRIFDCSRKNLDV